MLLAFNLKEFAMHDDSSIFDRVDYLKNSLNVHSCQ